MVRNVPVTNQALRQAGILYLRIGSGAGTLKFAAARISLEIATAFSFRPVLAIQSDPNFDFKVAKGTQLARFVERIKDPELRAFTKTALEQAPTEFFLKPSALSSSLHHPLDEFSIGGEVIHSARAAELASQLYPAMFGGQEAPDALLVSALLHDALSNMKVQDGALVFDPRSKRHGELTAAWIRMLAEREYPHLLDKLAPVISMVASHMGRWEGVDLFQRGALLDRLFSAIDIISAYPHAFVDYPGAPPWVSRDRVFGQARSDDKTVLPIFGQRWGSLGQLEKMELTMASELFRQYGVLIYGDMERATEYILHKRTYREEEMLADRLKFITVVTQAAAACPCLSIKVD